MEFHRWGRYQTTGLKTFHESPFWYVQLDSQACLWAKQNIKRFLVQWRQNQSIKNSSYYIYGCQFGLLIHSVVSTVDVPALLESWGALQCIRRVGVMTQGGCLSWCSPGPPCTNLISALTLLIWRINIRVCVRPSAVCLATDESVWLWGNTPGFYLKVELNSAHHPPVTAAKWGCDTQLHISFHGL